MTIPKHLMEAKLCNRETCEEIRKLKEELEKKNKKYWQSRCGEYHAIILLLEDWLKTKIEITSKQEYIEFYKMVLDKLEELKEKCINER